MIKIDIENERYEIGGDSNEIISELISVIFMLAAKYKAEDRTQVIDEILQLITNVSISITGRVAEKELLEAMQEDEDFLEVLARSAGLLEALVEGTENA